MTKEQKGIAIPLELLISDVTEDVKDISQETEMGETVEIITLYEEDFDERKYESIEVEADDNNNDWADHWADEMYNNDANTEPRTYTIEDFNVDDDNEPNHTKNKHK